MLRKTLVLITSFVLFSYFIYIDADQNLQENHADEIGNSEQDINTDSFRHEGFYPLQEADCHCTNGKCVNEGGRKICKCDPGYGNYSETQCKACDCGKDVVNCFYVKKLLWKNQICVCEPGYYYKDKKCYDCECGPDSNCTYDDGWLGKGKECHCKKGYKDVKGKCFGPCSDNPCENGGTCKDIPNGYECICPSKYKGKQCNVNDPCGDNPCMNGGTCKEKGNSYECECLVNFSGANCEKEIINPCKSNPCKNGGTCKKEKENTYKCDCPDNFLGHNCEIEKINPCKSNPCKNGGTCKKEKGNTYKCDCRHNFLGDNCEIETSTSTETSSVKSSVSEDKVTSEFTTYISTERTSTSEETKFPETSTVIATSPDTTSVKDVETTSEISTYVSPESTSGTESTNLPDTSTAIATSPETTSVKDVETTSEISTYVSPESTPATESTILPDTSTVIATSPETTSVKEGETTSEISTYVSSESTPATESTNLPETSVTTNDPKTSEPSETPSIIDEKTSSGQFASTTKKPSTFSTKQPDDENRNVCEEENPCQNGGACEMTEEMGYECNCRTGFSGKDCDTIQWCQENEEICDTAPCLYNEDTESGFCFCEDGLYFDAKTKMCEALDKCLFQRIMGNCSGDHETCDSNGNCICEENYAYNDDGTACEPDFCWKKSNKSRCELNMECTAEDETFSCSCIDGYRQIGEKCVEVDKCTPGISNCQQICTNGECSCFAGFSINEYYVNKCDRIAPDSECSLKCGKGSCVKVGAYEKCVCPQISHSYKNNTCIDRCTANELKNGECPEEVGCVPDEEHGYICNCIGKYDFAEDGVHCRAKRMCSEEGGNEDCELKGGLCEDDFALTEGYKCICNFGYEKNPQTGVCEHMCEKADCAKKQALCIINLENKAECICPPLLVNDTNGNCNKLAKYSYLGDFSVPRNKYQVVAAHDNERTKRDTLKDIDYVKLLKDFEDSMDNIFDGYEGTSILNCTDDGDDWKCFLEMKLNKDPGKKINIISTPTVCLPLSDYSHCLIPPDFIAKKRTADDAEVFHETNPCDKGVNGMLCGDETECKVSEPSGFSCECKTGYFRRAFFVPADNILIEVCEDKDECLNHTICPSNTTCHNIPGDYTCNCLDGYRLEEGKSAKIDGCRAVCSPNPCVHGTCSETGMDGFSCTCEGLYVGRFCNQTNEAITGIKKKGTQTAAITGGILGAFLVVAVIICIVLFRRFQKQKPIDEIEEYVRQRKRGLEMNKLGRRHPENQDIELRENERKPNRETKNQKNNGQHPANPIDSKTNYRPHLGQSTDKVANGGDNIPERRESGDYRKGYTVDDKMLPKTHSSRHSGEEVRRLSQRDDDKEEHSHKPTNSRKSSNHLSIETDGISRM